MAFTTYQRVVLLDLNTGDIDPATNNGLRKTYWVLNTLPLGTWNDFVVHVHWSATHGAITVGHRTSADASFTTVLDDRDVPTLQRESGVTYTNYVKQGSTAARRRPARARFTTTGSTERRRLRHSGRSPATTSARSSARLSDRVPAVGLRDRRLRPRLYAPDR